MGSIDTLPNRAEEFDELSHQGLTTDNNLGAAASTYFQPKLAKLGGKNTRTVCAYADLSATVNASSTTKSPQIDQQIQDCWENNNPIVSFSGPVAFHRTKAFYVQNQEAAAPTLPVKPSLIMQLVHAVGNSMTVNVNDKSYSLLFGSPEPVFKEIDGVPYMQGVLHLYEQGKFDASNPVPDKIIPFIELAPPFDGHKLSAEHLISCQKALAVHRSSYPDDFKNTTSARGQFSSAMGLCRGPAMLLLDRFTEKYCQADVKPGVPSFSSLAQKMITELRREIGRNDLIQSDQQYQELAKSFERLFDSKWRTASTSQPHTTGVTEHQTHNAAARPINRLSTEHNSEADTASLGGVDQDSIVEEDDTVIVTDSDPTIDPETAEDFIQVDDAFSQASLTEVSISTPITSNLTKPVNIPQTVSIFSQFVPNAMPRFDAGSLSASTPKKSNTQSANLEKQSLARRRSRQLSEQTDRPVAAKQAKTKKESEAFTMIDANQIAQEAMTQQAEMQRQQENILRQASQENKLFNGLLTGMATQQTDDAVLVEPPLGRTVDQLVQDAESDNVSISVASESLSDQMGIDETWDADDEFIFGVLNEPTRNKT